LNSQNEWRNTVKKIAVIYKSRYGATKQYAQWIAHALQAELFEASAVKPAQLKDYDVVVYGGGLYAGGISGVKLVAENPCKSLVVFTVGLADPQITDYTEILTKAFAPERLQDIKVFHLRGGVDYEKLSLVHKGVMAMVKKQAQKKPAAQRTSEDQGILETYGKKADFADEAATGPLVEYVRGL